MSTRKLAALLSVAVAAALNFNARADTPLTHFTPGDFVVIRGGDDTFTQSAYTEVPVYLDEYNPAGTYVGTLPIPSSGGGQLTLPGISAVSHEGALDLSPNGQWLTLTGYQFAPDTEQSGATANLPNVPPRVIGEVSVTASSLNTTTVVNAYPGNVIRAALTLDGKEFYVAGKYPNGGLQYVSGTGPTATTTPLQPTYDWRNIEDYNGILYGSTGSSSVGTHGVHMIGPLSPNITPANNTLITDYTGGNSSTDLAFLNLPTTDAFALSQNNLNVLYSVGDQHGPAITKFFYNGTSWEPSGGISNANLPIPDFNPTSIIAVPDPSNPAWVDLYASGSSGVFEYIDKSADPTLGISANNSSSAMSTLFAPQDPNEAFYGLALAPQLLGDANLDGNVDLSDLSIILNNFGKTTSAWTDGNFDHAATIDLTDLSDVLNNFGQSINPNASQSQITNNSATPVPEPAALLSLSLAVPFLSRRRRTRRSPFTPTFPRHAVVAPAIF